MSEDERGGEGRGGIHSSILIVIAPVRVDGYQ